MGSRRPHRSRARRLARRARAEALARELLNAAQRREAVGLRVRIDAWLRLFPDQPVPAAQPAAP